MYPLALYILMAGVAIISASDSDRDWTGLRIGNLPTAIEIFNDHHKTIAYEK